MKLAPVQSLAQLKAKAFKDDRYKTLAITAAKNLGGLPEDTEDYLSAIRWLEINASESEDEDEVVEEINFCLDLV